MSSPQDRDGLIRRIQVARELAERAGQQGLLPYLQHVVIDCVPEPRIFSEAADPWQFDLAYSYADRINWLGGLPPYVMDRQIDFRSARWPNGAPLNYWFGMPRGHDKTGSIGRAVTFLLRFSNRQLNMAVAAADRDQARLIVESMKREQALNPFLSCIDFQREAIYGPGGVLKVCTADAPSAFGKTLDLLLIDELTHWPKRDLFDALYSGQDKRPGAVTVVISNAGVKGSWQWDILNGWKADTKTSMVWECPPDTVLASWIRPQDRARIRLSLPRAVAKRVLDNHWIDPGEESGYLSFAEVMACYDQGLLPTVFPKPEYTYVAGIDYGPKRDRTALCVVHREHDNCIVVDNLTVLQGSPERPITIKQVEDWIDTVAIGLFRARLVVDPYQMEATIQRYEHHNPVVRFEPRGGKANYEMAETLRSLFVHRRFSWGPMAGPLILPDGRVETLADEMSRLVIKITPYGYRFDHTAAFHDDRACALGMASVEALREQTSGDRVWPVVEHTVKPASEVGRRAGVIERPWTATRELYGVQWGGKSWRDS